MDLVYGGGSVGLMGLVSQTAFDGGCSDFDGFSVLTTVIPTTLIPVEISGHAVGEVLIVSDMHERKAEMARRADAFVALPGIADIIGRRFGSMKLPFNQQKSWAGSISMFGCGFLISIGMLYYYSVLGYFQLDWGTTVQKVALVSLVATVVESLSTTDVVDDNISVPLASMAVAFFSFGY